MRLGVWPLLVASLVSVGPDPANASDPPAVVKNQADHATAFNNQGVAEAQAGRLESGISLIRQALALNPDDVTSRKNLSGMLTDWAGQLERSGQVEPAVQAWQEAVQVDPENGIAYVRLGDVAYLRQGDLDAALRWWPQAHGRVSAVVWQLVSARLSQAQRDRLIERTFARHPTPHFDIRYEASRSVDLAAIEQLLEESYARLTHLLDATPARLTVLLYSGDELHRAYQHRDWAPGLYDGRIRLRADELTAAYLPDMVIHELTHAFLHDQFGNRLPTWVHEGYAQLQERSRTLTPETARMEQGIQQGTQWIPLKWLDQRFERPSSPADVARAYLEARFVVGELIRRHGEASFRRFLEQLAQGVPVDRAYNTVFAPATWANADAGHFN